jgi:hypothetical protein
MAATAAVMADTLHQLSDEIGVGDLGRIPIQVREIPP